MHRAVAFAAPRFDLNAKELPGLIVTNIDRASHLMTDERKVAIAA